MELPLLSPGIAWTPGGFPYVFAKALEEVALVIKWPSKCPLGCLLPGCCLCGLVRFDVSLLPLGHSGTLENYFVASRPQSSMRKYDAVQGSSCVQNRLHSAVISSFWGPVPYLRTYPGWGGGDPQWSDLKTLSGFFAVSVLFLWLLSAGRHANGRPGSTQDIFSTSSVQAVAPFCLIKGLGKWDVKARSGFPFFPLVFAVTSFHWSINTKAWLVKVGLWG